MDTLFYSISIVVLCILFGILKKIEHKMDVIPNIIITCLCVLPYQFFVCSILSMLNIPITVRYLGIVNIICSAILGIAIKKKGIQQMVITVKDTAITLLLILFISMIAYQDVGKLENIRYSSTDASIHYIAAKEFYQHNQMLNKVDQIETDKQMMPMAYMNVGILFKAFAPIIGEINLYKIFVLFDITIFCFSGTLFYFILKKRIENKWHMLLAATMTILYLMGYPLNNLLSGFHYLGLGFLMMNAIFYIIEEQELNPVARRSILFLLNIGLILSYSLFAPVAYLSMFIDTIRKNKAEKKQIILDTIITLIIPGLIGVAFLLGSNIERVKILSLEGYIYKNLWSNIIFFVPFALYFLLKKIKDRNIDYLWIYFTTLIVFMGVLYIGTKGKIISQYYFYKNAYVLWAILLIYFFEGIKTFINSHKKQKTLAIVYLAVYLFFFAFGIGNGYYIFSMYDIYQYNNVLIHTPENLKQDDIKMLEYIKENNLLSKTENNVLFIGDFMQEAWIRSMFAYRNREPLEKANREEYIKKWNQGEIEYLVCFEDSAIYKRAEELLKLEKEKIIFQTEHAKLYAK